MTNRIFYLNHAGIFSIPFLGSVLYLLQMYLIKKDLITRIYMSRKKQKLQEKNIRMIKNSKIVFVQSSKFGLMLKNFNGHLVFDVPAIDVQPLTKQELYDLMWTGVFCRTITKRSKIAFKTFVPADFEEYKVPHINIL